MKFLLPSAGELAPGFIGTLTTYKTGGVPLSIKQGALWAGDNCAFVGFDERRFINWLEMMRPYRATCLFVVVPDVVGDALGTYANYKQWWPTLYGWPLAYVAQNGQEHLEWPGIIDFTDFYGLHCTEDDDISYWETWRQWQREGLDWTTLFIGGTDDWRSSETVDHLIAEAQEMGKHVHIGRVNYWRRYARFAQLPGSENFTCDGTRIRFDGRERTLKAWASYQAQSHLWSTPTPAAHLS